MEKYKFNFLNSDGYETASNNDGGRVGPGSHKCNQSKGGRDSREGRVACIGFALAGFGVILGAALLGLRHDSHVRLR